MDVDMHGTWGVLNLVGNLVIVAGYLLVPFTVLKFLPLSKWVRFAGANFFLTCAITHLSMAFGWEHGRWLVVNHLVQGVFVVWFVLGFNLLLRDALRRVKERETGG